MHKKGPLEGTVLFYRLISNILFQSLSLEFSFYTIDCFAYTRDLAGNCVLLINALCAGFAHIALEVV